MSEKNILSDTKTTQNPEIGHKTANYGHKSTHSGHKTHLPRHKILE